MNEISIPSYSMPITFVILYSILITRYFLLSALFIQLIKLRGLLPLGNNSSSKDYILRDIIWSLLSSLVFAAFGVVIIKLWQMNLSKIYVNVNDFPLWYLPVSLVIYLVLQDTYFYWIHRLMHKVRFRSIHRTHHLSRHPSAWTSFAFHPWEALIQAIILPIFVLLIPIHIGVFGLFLTLMSLFGVTNHLGAEIYPRFLEKRFGVITARHHQRHHQKWTKNYGLFFNYWDRLMGTEET